MISKAICLIPGHKVNKYPPQNRPCNLALAAKRFLTGSILTRSGPWVANSHQSLQMDLDLTCRRARGKHGYPQQA